MLSALPYLQGGKVFLCNSEQYSVLCQVLPLTQVIIKKAKRINVKGRKGICTQTHISFRHSFSLSGSMQREETSTHPPILRSVIWDAISGLGTSPSSGSHLLVQKLLVLPFGSVCCHICSEDMLTIFVRPRIIIQLFVKAPPILHSTSFLIISTEIQSYLMERGENFHHCLDESLLKHEL